MEQNSSLIADTDLLGTIDDKGLITTYTGKQALENSIKLWITSFKNDVIRSPNKGGYITQLLFKPMSESNRLSLIDSMIDGFNQDYTPTVILKSLTVTADYEQKAWIINLIVYVPILKDTVPVTTVIKNFV